MSAPSHRSLTSKLDSLVLLDEEDDEEDEDDNDVVDVDDDDDDDDEEEEEGSEAAVKIPKFTENIFRNAMSTADVTFSGPWPKEMKEKIFLKSK